MATYTIELNYKAAFVVDVKAENEGDALAKARELAEMAPMNSFFIIEEEDSHIQNIR